MLTKIPYDKPCPLCGKQRYFTGNSTNDGKYEAICSGCNERYLISSNAPDFPDVLKKNSNGSWTNRNTSQLRREIEARLKDGKKAKSKNIVKPSPVVQFRKQVELHFSGPRIRYVLQNYIKRPKQVELAAAISETLFDKTPLLAEAGVGIGKSLAYLIPLLLKARQDETFRPIIISTKTIALQEQLVDKDIELALQVINDKREVLLAKGKTHYLCRKNLEAIIMENTGASEALLEDFYKQVINKKECDRKNLPELPDHLWEKICVDKCSPSDCEFTGCQFQQLKKQRRNFRGIIVCNHDMFLTDLVLRANGHRGLWPTPYAVIFDEAHSLEEVTRRELTSAVSIKQLEGIIKRCGRIKVLSNYLEENQITTLLERIYALEKVIRENTLVRMEDNPGGTDEEETDQYRIKFTYELYQVLEQVYRGLNKLEDSVDTAATYGYKLKKSHQDVLLERLSYSLSRIRHDLKNIIQADTSSFLWVEYSNHNIKLCMAPVEIASFLRKMLWDKREYPIVLTSGTLKVKDSFEYIKSTLGINKCREFSAESPFDYQNRMMIYTPIDLPLPNANPEADKLFLDRAAERISFLLKCSNGRALVLFTSHRRMREIYQRLKAFNLEYPLLCQGDDNVGRLLKRFREDVDSVLLATGSFWEGVDVAGESLTCVIMDKLPFPNPRDPLIQSLHEKAKTEGLSPFYNIDLPRMLATLRQGAGRLLRQESDWGIVAILDRRAGTKYKSLLQATLPPGVWTSDIKKVENWLTDKFLESASPKTSLRKK